MMIPALIFSQSVIDWTKTVKLPANPTLLENEYEDIQPGLAGSYVGVIDGMLFIAGGANFPDAPPWEEGEKVYWDHIYMQDLEKGGEIKVADHLLPVRTGYGVSVEDEGRLLLIGGENEDGIVNGVWALIWNRNEGRIKIDTLASLPSGVRAIAGEMIGASLYIHGIREGENVFLRREEKSGVWSFLPPCPGPARDLPAAAVQSNGYRENFYLMSGRSSGADGKIE